MFVGVTMIDLFPSDKWNFVFGEASLVDRVGVFSFARYHPDFPDHFNEQKAQLSNAMQKFLLLRSLKTMVHECAHMLSLHHCIYFSCLMNGANSLEESDIQPIFLCPCCLRKLKWAIGDQFDGKERYLKLLQFFEQNQFPSEVAWLKKRIEGSKVIDKNKQEEFKI